VTKTPSATTAAIGETVTYQYAVVNTGNVTVNTLTLTDDKLGDIALNVAQLAPGETATGTATHTIVEADLPGPLTNTATAKATDSQNKPVTATATATVTLTYASSISVTKVPSSATARVGEQITYTYTVENTGSISISGLALSDDKLGKVTVDSTALAPGARATGTATYTVLEGDLPGPLTNIVTAAATNILKQPLTATATATVALTYTASMSVTKVPSSTAARVGDTLTYTYTIVNTGDVSLNALSLSDNKIGAIKPAKTTLVSGETTTATATYTVLEGDLPGPLTNIVTVTASDSQNQPVTATATATVSLTYTASLSVTKEPSTKTAAVGDTVTYKFTVKNTGSVTVNALTLTDDKLGSINPERTSLAPGETTTASIDHIIIETDLPSPLTNVVTAAANDILGQQVTSTATASVELTYTATVEMTKVASPASAKVGDTVSYTYTITNSGKVTISDLVLTDDKLGSITLDQSTVAPGGTATGRATYTIAVNDVPGPITNTALLDGKDPAGGSVSARATATVTITRDTITPTLTCVSANDDGTFTAFFGYDNPNSYPVTVEAGENNRFTSPPDDQGQPTTFEPGSQTAVFAVDSKGNSLVWHLEGSIAEANKNSAGCSLASCGLDGPEALCRNKEETYSYTGKEDEKFKHNYEWLMDDKSVGKEKSITISGSNFEMGEHKLKLKVDRNYKEKLWSSAECSMDVKVIPEPNADISMDEEGTD
jgi:uncharacterized repeat protein (TIGR01451 family)